MIKRPRESLDGPFLWGGEETALACEHMPLFRVPAVTSLGP